MRWMKSTNWDENDEECFVYSFFKTGKISKSCSYIEMGQLYFAETEADTIPRLKQKIIGNQNLKSSFQQRALKDFRLITRAGINL